MDTSESVHTPLMYANPESHDNQVRGPIIIKRDLHINFKISSLVNNEHHISKCLWQMLSPTEFWSSVSASELVFDQIEIRRATWDTKALQINSW